MATENRDDPDPRGHFWFFKDPVGLELWPYERTPYTASIGHRVHGKAMTTGYPPGIEHPHWNDYDKAQDNIKFESLRWNCAKWNFPSSTYSAMLEGLQHLRSGPEMREIWEIDGLGDGHGGGQDDGQGSGQGSGQGNGQGKEFVEDGIQDFEGKTFDDGDDGEDDLTIIKQAQFDYEEEGEDKDFE